MRLAAHLGHPAGRRTRIYLTAAGIGTRPDHGAAMEMLRELADQDKFAAVQLSMLGHATCEQPLTPTPPKIVSTDPYYRGCPGLFGAAECKYLAMVAAPDWKKPG